MKLPGDTPSQIPTSVDALRGEGAPPPRASSVGSYRLLQKLGEGGMGEVWLAEQATPIHRTVAVKLIKAGMDTRAVVARFESERQALALMDHPNIAKVFDAGSTSDGHPYFVMEYVSGTPLTDYCDKNRLGVRERLQLFIQVCEGVQHAHQKAILHRDLKPSNILVVSQDDKAVPKIIDFGLAKAIGQRLTEKTLFTELGAILGTPGYMSPEQADLTGRNVDTRTDVYSLGIVLYELLVGALPFDPKELCDAGFEGMLRKIRDQEPARPSTRVRTLRGESQTLAENRREGPDTLARRLRGELDWITMKALERDRSRRYGSPSDLAADIDRYLRDEPVLACPPSASYRAKKFVHRHRLGVGIGAAAVLLLLAFAVTMTVQARRIAKERDRANLEAQTSRHVSEFLTGMFEVSDPNEAKGNSVTAREILDKAASDIEVKLGNDPALQARMMDTIGNVYGSLGLYSRSKNLLEKALEIQRRICGPAHPDTLATMRHLAATLGDNGEVSESETLNRELLDVERRVLGPRDPETIKTLANLATYSAQLGRYTEAEQHSREALDMSRSVMGSDNWVTLKIAASLSNILTGEGKYAEAEKLARESLEITRRALGTDHPVAIDLMTNLAYALSYENQMDEAVNLIRDAYEISRRVYGPEHQTTLLLMNNLGSCEVEAGHYEEGASLLREALAIERRVLGANQYTTAITKYNLARVHAVQGRRDEALSLLRDAVDHGLAPSTINDLETEKEWGPLRNDAGFIKIVEDLRKRYTASQSPR